MCFTEVLLLCEGADFIEMARDRCQWRALVKTINSDLIKS
jgi:hypothetical protein